MLILDASVLLSPYLSEIVSRVDPPSFRIAHTFDQIMREKPPFPVFRNLAAFCQVEEDEEEKELLRLRERTIHEVQKLNYKPVISPEDRNGSEVYRHLRKRLGPYDKELPATLRDLFPQQIWGALYHKTPILAVGSPVPRIWEKLEEKFPSQLNRKDLRSRVTGLIVELNKLRISVEVFDTLRCWLIDVLAPSTTEIGYLGPDQFMKRLKFVAFSFENSSPTEQSSKSPE